MIKSWAYFLMGGKTLKELCNMMRRQTSIIQVVKETHVAVTSEPDGQYRYHLTPDEPVFPHKPAQGLYMWMVKNGIDKDVLVLGGDSTNSNSGWDGGAMTWVERMLGRKLYWVIWCLHCNELLLRHVISKLDGKTTSKDGFSGPIGKLIAKVNSMERNYNFKPIPGLEELLDIPQDIVKNMSTDSSIFYQLGLAVRSGKLSKHTGRRWRSQGCGEHWFMLVRVVCQVTAASAAVVGFEARDGYIRAKQAHRVALPKFSTKQDSQPLFNKL